MKNPGGRSSRFAGDQEKAPLEDYKRGRPSKTPSSRGSERRSWPTMKGGGWSGSLKQRARVAKRLPQAVVKVTSYNKGLKKVIERMEYAARENADRLETERGEIIVGKAEIRQLAEDWSVDFTQRKNGRDAMALVVSLPAGTDKQAAEAAARAFLADIFGENHRYVFAAHDDTKHYHLHAVVKMRGENGKQLRTDRAVLQRWRERMAEKAKEQGIMLDASPRYARGKGRKAARSPVDQIRRRGQVPEVDRAATAARTGKGAGKGAETELEHRQAATNGRERVDYARHAAAVAAEAAKLNDPQRRVQAMETAAALADYARSMPVPRSPRQTLADKLEPRGRGGERPPGQAQAEPYLQTTARALGRMAKDVRDPALVERARAAAATAAGSRRQSRREQQIER
ncbi:MAG: relaxase/mobilization nuclease domain-containing protein [Kiloniellales bacterium]|nr:relaxase/mobilization nuclease domain-containing protein [Kiloniellales bacterium]